MVTKYRYVGAFIGALEFLFIVVSNQDCTVCINIFIVHTVQNRQGPRKILDVFDPVKTGTDLREA